MAQDITLMGASYEDVPSVQLPKTGGGLAEFFDVNGSETFTQNGTYDVSALAQAVVNVAGGGGGGLEYETGTWTPAQDVTSADFTFSKTHTEAPILLLLMDATGTSDVTSDTAYALIVCDTYKLTGNGFPYGSTSWRYGFFAHVYRQTNANSTSFGGNQIQYNSDNAQAYSGAYMRYWMRNTGFTAYSNSTSRYWRAGRTYKWIAVWKP